MAILKRYVSYSPLTIQLDRGKSKVLLQFSGKNPNAGYFFETIDAELQKLIEESPFYGKMFNCEAPQQVDDNYHPVTVAPSFPKEESAPVVEKKTGEGILSVYQPLLEVVKIHFPEAKEDNYQELAIELIKEGEKAVKKAEATLIPVQSPGATPAEEETELQTPVVEKVEETPVEKEEEVSSTETEIPPRPSATPPGGGEIAAPIIESAENEAPEVTLPVKEVRTLAAAKKWLAELGETCSPRTNTADAIEMAKEKGFTLVINKDLEE